MRHRWRCKLCDWVGEYRTDPVEAKSLGFLHFVKVHYVGVGKLPRARGKL